MTQLGFKETPDTVDAGVVLVQARWRSALGIAAICLALYLPGIHWGVPALVAWSQDTIAGVRTLGAVEAWPHAWTGRYPPLHYLVLRAAYEPAIRYWRSTGQAASDPATGRLILHPPHTPKIGTLIVNAGVISAVMGVGAVLALREAARALTDDNLVADLSSVSFATGAAFTYFAHLGNVDVPSVFWFALSLVCYARALRTRSWIDTTLLGLFGSLCISTKDNWAGVYPGMAAVLLVDEWRLRRRGVFGENLVDIDVSRRGEASPVGRTSSATLLQWRWALGLGAFIAPYALLNGILTNPQAWLDRLGALADVVGGSEFRHPSQVSLALETARQSAGAVGWPMLAAIVGGGVYTLLRIPRLAFVLLIPALSYYLIVIARIGFVYERFLFAPLAMLTILAGAGGAALLRRQTISALSIALPVCVLLSTLAYAVAVDLEMMTDSRYDAEAWLGKNAPKSATIGALTGDAAHFAPQYLPRVHEMGYATFPVLAERESFGRPQPDYLILSSYDQQDFNAAQSECVGDLLAGRFGYECVAVFRGRFLGAASSWLSVAGWYAPPPGKISPTITVFRKTGGASAATGSTESQATRECPSFAIDYDAMLCHSS